MSQPGLEENINPEKSGRSTLKDRVSDDCGCRQPLESLDDNRPGDKRVYRERKGDVYNEVYRIMMIL